MKQCLWFLFLGLAVLAKAEDSFLESLPPEAFAKAGLTKLTPEELQHLQDLVNHYRANAATVAQAPAEAVRSTSGAETQPVAAANEAAKDTAKSESAAETSKASAKEPSWFKALLTINQAAAKPQKAEALESELVGDFKGWNGRTLFRLKNGTEWMQQNTSEVYVHSPALRQPVVRIKPAPLAGFWLEVKGVNPVVRVVPSKLVELK